MSQRISFKMQNSVLDALGGHAEVQKMVEQISVEFVNGLVLSGQMKNVFKYINDNGMLGDDRHWMSIPKEAYGVIKQHFNRRTSEVILVWIRAYLNSRREQTNV